MLRVLYRMAPDEAVDNTNLFMAAKMSAVSHIHTHGSPFVNFIFHDTAYR